MSVLSERTSSRLHNIFISVLNQTETERTLNFADIDGWKVAET